MKTTTKNFIVLFSILILAGIAANFFLFARIKSNVERAYAAQIQSASTASQIEDTVSLKNLMTNLQPSINDLSGRVVASSSVAAFIEQLEGTARAKDLEITISSVNNAAAPVHPEAYQLLELDFSTEGSWQNTHDVVELLEAMPYKLDLTSVTLSGTGSVWSGEFTLTVVEQK